MVAFGGLVSCLPSRLVQPAVGLGLGLSNLVAFVVLVRRAREGGPEQRGWILLTLSFLGIMASNVTLVFTHASLTTVSPLEGLFFSLQLVIAALQAWALLSWPFQSFARTSHRVMNLLGCLIFSGSLFLVLWSAALIPELDHGHWPIFFRMMGLAVRVAIVGGLTTYFLADDPRRIRGPLGWLLVAAVAIVALIIIRPYLYDQNALIQPSPLFGIVLSAPIFFGLAAWLHDPVEVSATEARLRYPMVEGLIFLPFMAAGGVLIAAALHHQEHLLATLIAFMAISGLLLIRQFLLLREVRGANERLEDRVLARTRSLEELQHIMLRTERLNSIGALGAGLAHDLNNALTSILASAELTRMRLEQGEMPSLSDMDRILVASDQSATLTGKLMAFARQEDEVLGQLDLAEEASNLEGILRMLLTRQTTLKMDLGERPVLIHGSRSQVEQILVNLVGNARDAMPKGGLISLSIRVEPHASPATATLEVSDTGEGIPPEIQARMFQPFFTTKPPGKGTGLGLTSVKHLMESAGGSIDVESTPGRGTRFQLRFLLIS
jgi:signal transduction histidine kinase